MGHYSEISDERKDFFEMGGVPIQLFLFMFLFLDSEHGEQLMMLWEFKIEFKI